MNETMDISTPQGMAAAVAWQKNHVSMIKDGGAWVVPRSGNVIKVEHSKRTATFVVSPVEEPDIVRVFEAMGWRVIMKNDSYPLERN